MARGGINKRLVLEAYDALVLKGQNPSIDAIRIEMGNTGSKTTIHRYLKEIEQERGTRLDDEALLSDTIKDMINQLASRLHEEANAIVEQANTRHDVQLSDVKKNLSELKQQLTTANEKNVLLVDELAEKNVSLSDVNEQLQKEKQHNQRLQQHVDDLDVQLDEKNARIQSLEEKHTHARDALEHFRNSVKEQREQDQRRHEQQIQQVQAESRKLGQDIIVKQEQLSQLNKDNARLVTELKGSNKQIMNYESTTQQSKKELMMLREKLAKSEATFESRNEDNKRLLRDLGKTQKDLKHEIVKRQSLEIQLAQALSETVAQERLLKDFKTELVKTSRKQPISTSEA